MMNTEQEPQPATTTDLIAQVIEGLDAGAMVTKFVVVAEVIDSTGERAVWTDTHAGASWWDTYGLLAYAMENEAAEHVAGIQRWVEGGEE